MHESIRMLQETYEGDGEDSRPFLEVISKYSMRSASTVERILEELELANPEGGWTRAAAIACMKELADLGFGKFIKGAKGPSSRIEWWFPPISIHKAALGDTEELEQLLDDAPQSATTKKDEYRDKERWTFGETISVLEQMTGVPAGEIFITLTIPEARRMLAEAQGIPLEDVQIRMG